MSPRYAVPCRTILLFLLTISFLTAFPTYVGAQRADHLTDEEIELVRDVQSVDDRMEIYVRAIERRLIAIDGTGGLGKDELKRLEKEKGKWGELPGGGFSQMVSDIYGILDEAVNKIEDVSDHNKKSKLLPHAVYILSDYSTTLIPKLEDLKKRATSARDVSFLNQSISTCNDIIEAASKIPRPDPKDRGKVKKELMKRRKT